MLETSRILTEEDAKVLERLFIDDKDVKQIKQFISEKLTSRHDWREFGHQDIFTKLNFYKGYLEKLQAVRNNVSCSTIEEIIKILYAMGYTQKRICFLLWQFGFDHDNIHIIKGHIKRNRFYLERERVEFMELMDQTKNSVFQSCALEVKKAEEETIKIYIRHVKELTTALESIDPVEEWAKCKRIKGQIDGYMETLQKAHGIQDIRTWQVKVEAQKQIMQEQSRLNAKGTRLTPEEITNGGTKPDVPVEASFMSAPAEIASGEKT